LLVDGQLLHGANLFTIGIELGNLGYLHRSHSGKFFYESAGTMEPYVGEAEPIRAALIYDNGVQVDG
jgi:hypothetical protein